MEQKSIKQIIADNIKFYRERNNLQKKEVAEYVGVSASSVTHWEDGSNSIDINKLAILCSLFNCKLSEIVTSREEQTQEKPLTHDEQQLINDYRNLSAQGQEYIRQTMFLAKQTYKKSSDTSLLEEHSGA